LTDILSWVRAHANLPTRARWIAKADVAPRGATKREEAGPPLKLEGFLFSDSVFDPHFVCAHREPEFGADAVPQLILLRGTPRAGHLPPWQTTGGI